MGRVRRDTVHRQLEQESSWERARPIIRRYTPEVGDIILKGSSTATGQADDRDESGIYQWGQMTMKSGRGSITMQGTSGEYQGIGFTAPLSESDTGVKQLSMVSSKTSGTAIQLTGSSSGGVGVSFNYLNPKEVLSLGGGQVAINGTEWGATGLICRTWMFFRLRVTQYVRRNRRNECERPWGALWQSFG